MTVTLCNADGEPFAELDGIPYMNPQPRVILWRGGAYLQSRIDHSRYVSVPSLQAGEEPAPQDANGAAVQTDA